MHAIGSRRFHQDLWERAQKRADAMLAEQQVAPGNPT